jgi:predicted nucleic acid-binding protein
VRYVADASSVVAYLLGEGSPIERDAMVGDAGAPDLLDVEVTQTVRGLLHGGKITLARAEAAREDLAALSVRRHPAASLLRRSWELRDVCSTYDALYVALAEALDAALVTRDGRLAEAVRRLVPVAVWTGGG